MPSANRPGGSLSPIIEAIFSRPTLHTYVSRWETSLHGASSSAKQLTDKQQVKLHCRWGQSAAQVIEIGDDHKEKIAETDCVVEIHTAERLFAELEAKDQRREDTTTSQGLLLYTEPKHRAEGESGTLRCVIYMGGYTVRELVRLLTLPTAPNVDISMTLRAAYEPDANALTLLTAESHSYAWSGKGALEIVDTAVYVTLPEVDKSKSVPADAKETVSVIKLAEELQSSLVEQVNSFQTSFLRMREDLLDINRSTNQTFKQIEGIRDIIKAAVSNLSSSIRLLLYATLAFGTLVFANLIIRY